MPTDYAGEGYLIRTGDEKNFDQSALTPADVLGVAVQVFATDEDGLVAPPVVDEDAPYNATRKHWGYLWNTAGVPDGTYKAWVIITNLDLSLSIEGPKRIRLKRDPRP